MSRHQIRELKDRGETIAFFIDWDNFDRYHEDCADLDDSEPISTARADKEWPDWRQRGCEGCSEELGANMKTARQGRHLLASLNIVAQGDDWWSKMSPTEQQQYVKDHPGTKKQPTGGPGKEPSGGGEPGAGLSSEVTQRISSDVSSTVDGLTKRFPQVKFQSQKIIKDMLSVAEKYQHPKAKGNLLNVEGDVVQAITSNISDLAFGKVSYEQQWEIKDIERELIESLFDLIKPSGPGWKGWVPHGTTRKP